MNPIVEAIQNLEREYGHNELFVGVSNEEGALDKISLVLNTFGQIDYESEVNNTAEVLRSLSDLINARALSPESAAYILFLAHPDDNARYRAIDQIYRNRSTEDHAVFQAVYFAKKYEESMNTRALYESVIERNNILIDKYQNRYCKNRSEIFKGKCAVYTVITGGYEELNDPKVINPEWDYYCFTDDPQKISSNVWNIRKLDNIIENDPARTQRYAKMHPFLLLPEYDYTIYIDGSFTISGDLSEYINTYSRECTMLCFPHPSRQKLEDEVEAIKVLRYHQDPGVKGIFDEQVEFYRSEGYDDSLPLIETGCLVRSNHDELLNKVMEDWWQEIKNRGHRDQLSIGYVCWKNGYQYDISNISVTWNKYLEYRDHADRYK